MSSNTRRGFLATVTTGLTAAASQRVLGANDRIRLGIIGTGARGSELMTQALECPNVEFVGMADIFTKRLEGAKKIAPAAKTHLDYHHLLEDKSVDAVIIATPQHLHREHFCASLEAGKHVYQEKTMAFSVAHAKAMRNAVRKAPKQVVQIGHQFCSSGHMQDALQFLHDQKLGKITGIHMTMFRNTPHGKPQWSRPVTPDMTPENIIWNLFLGDSAKRPFDPNRYANWRFFWDYSGGNVYENMSHQVSFWQKALDLKIPRAVTMTGGVYLWKDGREVPDTMHVALEQPEEILLSWDSGFGNSELGINEAVLGTDGTILHDLTKDIRYKPQKINNKDGKEVIGERVTPKIAHLLNFMECIRNGAKPNCPFELGYRTSIACRMAVESYRQQRTMRWDADREEIV